MNRSTYLIYSPVNDQSLVIVAFLRKYFPTSYIIGVFLQDNTKLIGKRYYDEIIDIEEVESAKIDGIKIPSGALATKYLLEKGDVTLGSIILKQPMLKVFSKSWMLSKAIQAGIVIPETWYTLEEISRYPLFYKQRYEQGGGVRGVAFKENNIPKNRRESLLFQELVNSSGTYGVSFLADKGELLITHTHFERESIPKVGGSAIYIECFKDERLLRYTTQLVKHLNYSGWGLAEFKYCPCREDYVFMEINAKFWSSCELAFTNEPLFLKLLFNIDSREKAEKKIFFPHRALSRSFIFFLRHFYCFWGDVKISSYPISLKALVSGLIPHRFLQIIKNTTQ
ncbi:hypothetical protein D0962_27980 [Leptolyngbyaceae cyanobacterium CCMR0082]|uniref:ATP-grasp domain-containing protein n=1 Tax=Adonisia turfae CCMR0082 TaxID=2304604 RepID=A0A6M0SDJ4_9CYAN|nr:hypothetical protein [Adonisia turfae]MDV3350378.1 hypothetical protein [Leptothoe sp. LEGE 181152]NEZ66555.1 hypothetical protein [Adonisia turfae CCMR0082]